MWLVSRTGVFTYFCNFSAKNFGNQRNENRIRKTKEQTLKKMYESIIVNEIVNQYIEKTAKNVKSSDEAVEVIHNMEKIT